MEKIFNSRIVMKHDTTSNWNANPMFIPKQGEVIVYEDYITREFNGRIVNVPNFKIGDGLAYCIDLPWVNQDLRDQLEQHMLNTVVHITPEEREFWNNKIRNDGEVKDEVLTFTIH